MAAGDRSGRERHVCLPTSEKVVLGIEPRTSARQGAKPCMIKVFKNFPLIKFKISRVWPFSWKSAGIVVVVVDDDADADDDDDDDDVDDDD
eukprot:5843281-Amphidinium_carterae.1